MFMPLPITVGGEHYVSRLSVCLSIVCPLFICLLMHTLHDTMSLYWWTVEQGCGVRVRVVSRCPGFGLESQSHLKEIPRLWALSVTSGVLCSFVAVCLTFVQFILQLKLCLYTIVHFSLEEFINFSQVILKYTIVISHHKSQSRSSKFLVPQLKCHKKQGLCIPAVEEFQ